MASLKTIAKDTAIYGMSSIIGRFLNYLLVPLYTACMSTESGGYGVVTNVYAYVALVLVLLTFGMETTFFRFANKESEDPRTVLSNTFWLVGVLSALWLLTVLGGLPWIADAIGYAEHPWYIGTMAAVVAIDAVQAVLFSWLRFTNRPLKFATLKLLFIAFNITLNCIWYIWLGATDPTPCFYINLACTASITLLFIPELRLVKWGIDRRLMRQMLAYSWPVLVLGLAGILNQAADKMIFPLVYPDHAEGMTQLSIYGACVKIAMIMAMITQAFRYAYEPFVFSATRDADAKTKYAVAMKYFLIFTLLAFLCVTGGMPLLRFIIAPGYWEGLRVVPIVMAAEIMMGIYFNLSFWYKLIDKTIYGAWFSLAGCVVLLMVNILGIPRWGYMACAWGGVAGYGTAMVLSYIVGQRKNPFPYDLRSMASYILIAALFFVLMTFVPKQMQWGDLGYMAFAALLIVAFVGHIYWHDLRIKRK